MNAPKYVKLYNLFLGFISAKKPNLQGDYELRLLNLILSNFDRIAEVGTAHGKRAELLKALIRDKNDVALGTEPALPSTGSGEKVFPFLKLESIDVSDFRGFSHPETIPFHDRFTLVYGPNGSGKSSFCEALEYAMLDYINEAIAKRIEIGRYIRSETTGKGVRPSLKAKSETGAPIPVSPNPTLFHFCFIEKSRIEDFGRIAASKPAEKASLLDSLFGLKEFSEFVGNFTDNIEKYFGPEDKKAEELKLKSEALKVHEQNIARAQEALKEIAAKKKRIADDSGLARPFQELDSYLNGDDARVGRLSQLDNIIGGESLRSISSLNTDDLRGLVLGLESSLANCLALKKKYDDAKSRVSFRDLYSAVLSVEDSSKEFCPACETPLSKTTKDPYINAKEKLSELSDIAVLEKKCGDAGELSRQSAQTLNTRIEERNVAAKSLFKDKPLSNTPKILVGPNAGPADQFSGCRAIITHLDEHKDEHKALENAVEAHNKAAAGQEGEKEKARKEKRLLTALSRQMTEVNTEESSTTANILAWQKEIEDFKKQNLALILAVDAEKAEGLKNAEYVKAYRKFLSELREYKESLPIQHLQALNSLTRDLYNSINAHDTPFEKAAEIRLPGKSDDPISISFTDSPGQFHDALQMLSEGHIRCLGLAILLAKNIQDRCPIIVFDDVVNAIDDDHRGGVGRVIFGDHNLSSKQIILTTHAENFMRELEHLVPAQNYDATISKITLTSDRSSRRIRIKHNARDNHLIRATEALSSAQKSDALYHCRCALEQITRHLWKKIGKKYKTEFKVVIRSPDSEPDLMSVVQALNKFVADNDHSGVFVVVKPIFGFLLGLETKSSIIWDYLNKGTHEGEAKPEFDDLLVKEIIEKVVDLDSAVKNRNGSSS